MLNFTVIVTAYDNAAFLPACLESVAHQTHPAWRCVVVNDASPDETSQVAHRFADADERFLVIDLPENRGLHLARKVGIEACQDGYSLFLDADDELAPTALERFAAVLEEHGDNLPDMLHFGIDVVADGVSDEEARSFADYINAPTSFLDASALRRATFAADGGYSVDWRVTQRVYRTALAKRAFKAMTNQRLERAEDSYEFLVLSDLANGELSDNENRALRYHYGRGVTGSKPISSERFEAFIYQFHACIQAMEAYVSVALSDDILACIEGAKIKLLDLLMNDWNVRLTDDDQVATAVCAADVFGFESIATQLMRLARDESYTDWVDGSLINGSERYIRWFHIAEELISKSSDAPGDAYNAMRLEARDHIADLERRAVWVPSSVTSTAPIKRSSYERESIRIFVTTHKDVDTFYSDILQPVQVGPTEGRRRLMWALQDDDGENIAHLNPQYCELTTQYWAWKNVQAEYYGFCHYRRYFDFSEERHEENPYGEIIDDRVGWGTRPLYHMDDDSIRAAVEGCDVLTTGVNDFNCFPEAYADPLDLYRRSPYLHGEDLERMIDILLARYPDFAEDAHAYMEGHTSCFCNMFIMRRELFFKYCSWLFPLLDEFVSGWDTSMLSHQSLRTPGHLAERLLNIFLLHEKRLKSSFVWKQLQCVHFEHPEHVQEPRLEALVSDGRSIVPVVFAADDAYVPMLATTICSMLENASHEVYYDIVIMERDISAEHKRSVTAFLARYENAHIRFADVTGLIDAYHLTTNNPHISVETYYRFLIQRILPSYDKVLYLDADLIVEGDVSRLFEVELGDNLLAATHDIDFVGNLDIKGENRLAYARDVLHLADPYGYFQAGVLVLNLREMKKLHTLEAWLDLASDSAYLYDDQDILNAECQGRVVYLDDAWNVMVNCDNRFHKVFSFAPADMYDSFMKAYKDPLIVHYAGYEKPWKPGPCDQQLRYWRYARKTPFYEQLLFMVCADRRSVVEDIAQAKAEIINELTTHERALSEDSPVRGIADTMLPMGSRRREIMKSVARKLRGRK